MVALFAFEFVAGNTVTRLQLMRLHRVTQETLSAGAVPAELENARAKHVPTITHFLELPVLFVIIALGIIRPTSWTLLFIGSGCAIVLVALLTVLVPRLYPWRLGAAVRSS